MTEKMPSVSNTESVILEMLMEHDELYGLEMIAKNGTLKRGTIYVTLDRMEDKGLVSSREVEPPAGSRGPSRRVYKLTGFGVRIAKARRIMAAAWSAERGIAGVV